MSKNLNDIAREIAPKNLNDIAREIAQDDDIKSELSKAADFVIKLKEKQKNDSLSEIESSALEFLEVLLESSK
jgi:D-arabinose 5-phosphate isomerase GutQ